MQYSIRPCTFEDRGPDLEGVPQRELSRRLWKYLVSVESFELEAELPISLAATVSDEGWVEISDGDETVRLTRKTKDSRKGDVYAPHATREKEGPVQFLDIKTDEGWVKVFPGVLGKVPTRMEFGVGIEDVRQNRVEKIAKVAEGAVQEKVLSHFDVSIV